ncbi:hypothetical protein C446_04560 [Halobiforma nitratireducens JCM 10879]|uniref:Uncharacterized protein n=1 Tax=Halobiforma nitratireducens JCM 10879 TaxID=1227454 RepID=M0MBB0_9EURY|nr:hypothetical protein C446_04560 [Halobiforma nitratireducens JCM 10879]
MAHAGCLTSGSVSDDDTDDSSTDSIQTGSIVTAERYVSLRGEFVSEEDRPDSEHVYDSDADRFQGTELATSSSSGERYPKRSNRRPRCVHDRRGGLTAVGPHDVRTAATEAASHAEPVPPTDALYTEHDGFVLRVRLHEQGTNPSSADRLESPSGTLSLLPRQPRETDRLRLAHPGSRRVDGYTATDSEVGPVGR